MAYRLMSNPGIGIIDNPIDTPGGVGGTNSTGVVDLSSRFNNMNGEDVAAQIPQSSGVDLTSAFYYLTGGTPPSSMQTPSTSNPNVVTTPGPMGDIFGGFLRYVQENPGPTFLFAILLMLMVGGSPGYQGSRR